MEEVSAELEAWNVKFLSGLQFRKKDISFSPKDFIPSDFLIVAKME